MLLEYYDTFISYYTVLYLLLFEHIGFEITVGSQFEAMPRIKQ